MRVTFSSAAGVTVEHEEGTLTPIIETTLVFDCTSDVTSSHALELVEQLPSDFDLIANFCVEAVATEPIQRE